MYLDVAVFCEILLPLAVVDDCFFTLCAQIIASTGISGTTAITVRYLVDIAKESNVRRSVVF